MRPSATRAAIAALLLIVAGCRSGAPEVPLPPLGDAEPLVRERIEEAVAAVREKPGSAAAWGRLGEIYDVHRYLAQARSCYEKAEDLAPDDWRWPYFAGLALRDTDSASARRRLERAVRLRPDYAPAWFYLGLGALQAEDLDAAETYFRRSLEEDPGLVNGTLGLARVALARGDPRAAAELVERAARSAPDEAAVHEQRAQIYRLLGDAARAEEAERAARSSPIARSVLGFASLPDPVREEVFLREGVSSLWLDRRGRGLAMQDGVESVVDDLRRAIEVEPGRIDTRLSLARTLARAGRLDEARQEIERALAIDPESAESLAELGSVLIRSGQPGPAERACRRALELDPELHATRATLGGLLVGRGAFDEGLELLRVASRALPENADVQHNLASGLVQAGRADEALPIAAGLVERRPDYAPGLTLLGTLQALRGELDASVASLARALDIDPDDADARAEMGRSLWELGRFGEAIEAFSRAASLRTGDAEIARELAWALATCPRREVRDGPRALRIARTLCERSAFSNPLHLDVLAAAQAETGDFAAAGRTADAALEIVERTLGTLDAGDTRRQVLEEFTRELRARRALYRSGAPYRQNG